MKTRWVAWMLLLCVVFLIGLGCGERIGKRDYSGELAVVRAENAEMSRQLAEVAEQHDPLLTLQSQDVADASFGAGGR